ncbi:hypothetical protein [Histidinibacterium aquaticum]|uniref:Sulfotransferase domain-containing protein n=1 Tax=Histidinibacterium aquaticum TaxID=2613962 RepID=A0A5J5GAW0_9RHOB|nr:hypothetical protein [Histidinibacterium aquaticum]KAA9005043.1 hypothetical protein F3S47_18615 [Histidinibacterium aquaticum]
MPTHQLPVVEFGGDILIHLGPHKTGSTSIQKFLAANTACLRESEVLYLEGGRRDISRRGRSIEWGPLKHYHHPLIKDMIAGNRVKMRLHAEQMQNEIEAHRPRMLIVSSEVLARPSVTGSFVYEHLRGIFRHANRSWILYLRRQDDLVVSLFTEGLKKGKYPWPVRILSTADARHLDHRTRLEKIALSTSGDRVIVKSYEREKEDLIRSFLSEIGGANMNCLKYLAESNQSASARAINLQRLANMFPSAAKKLRQRALEVDAYLNDLGVGSRGAQTLLGPRDRERIQNEYRDSNLFVEREYFGGEDSGLIVKK